MFAQDMKYAMEGKDRCSMPYLHLHVTSAHERRQTIHDSEQKNHREDFNISFMAAF